VDISVVGVNVFNFQHNYSFCFVLYYIIPTNYKYLLHLFKINLFYSKE